MGRLIGLAAARIGCGLPIAELGFGPSIAPGLLFFHARKSLSYIDTQRVIATYVRAPGGHRYNFTGWRSPIPFHVPWPWGQQGANMAPGSIRDPVTPIGRFSRARCAAAPRSRDRVVGFLAIFLVMLIPMVVIIGIVGIAAVLVIPGNLFI